MTRDSSTDGTTARGGRTTADRAVGGSQTRRSFLRATGVGAATVSFGVGSAVGQEEETESPEEEPTEEDSTEDDPTEVTFALEGLPALEEGYYEGWAIYGEEKVSTGVFAAAEEELSFAIDADLSMTERVAITIEPDDEMGGEPSGIVVLAGEVEDGSAELSFPTAFEDVAGSYILATPTAPLVGGESGVWFLEPGEETSASLSLPELTGGWIYEGWVVHEGVPISTGRFSDPAGADGSGIHEGRGDGPPFPGEDLITNEPDDDLLFPSDLTDGETAIAITVEPALDGTDPTGPAPYPIKPLEGAVPADAEPMTSYELEATGMALPSGTATIESGEMDDGVPIGEYTARDGDGDGLHEDVNGNGRLDSDDVVVFFDLFEDDAIQAHADAFDFSESEDVGFDDVVALYLEM